MYTQYVADYDGCLSTVNRLGNDSWFKKVSTSINIMSLLSNHENHVIMKIMS